MFLLAALIACKGGGDTEDTDDTDTAVVLDVCDRWKSDRAYWNGAIWTGDIDACDAGTLDPSSSDAMLRGVNLYRFLAGVAPVTLDPAKSAVAQECALILDANEQFMHVPPTTAECFTAEGGNATARSLIAPVGGVPAVDAHMLGLPFGTDSYTLKERRFLLSNATDTIGVGSTPGWSCINAIGGAGTGGPQYTTWPPAGDFPRDALMETTQPDSAWSIQSDLIDFSGASIHVFDTVTGFDLPIDVGLMANNQGSRYALAWAPKGWAPPTDEDLAYRVEITGLAEDITYEVNVKICFDDE